MGYCGQYSRRRQRRRLRDVVVGADGYDNGETDEGRAFLYYGSPTGLGNTPAWTGESNRPAQASARSTRRAMSTAMATVT